MAKSGAGKKASAAQKAQYAPKSRPPPPQPKPHPVHLLPDEALKKIVQRVLEELKSPGSIPSEVIHAALAEVRDAVERTAAGVPLQAVKPAGERR
jgi:hypothetical protein